VPELVAMLSRSVALQPGDLIFTGTPAGVGPLQAGDVVSGGVTGIGQFSLTMGSAPSSARHADSTPVYRGAL
jgi:fumarylpyruvate hydrolase